LRGLKNLGEAEWGLGYPELGRRYFVEAEAMAKDLDRVGKAHVFTNLAAAAMRLKEPKMEIGYIKKYLEVAPDEWSSDIVNASARLGELMR